MSLSTFAFDNDPPDEGDYFAGPGDGAAAQLAVNGADADHTFAAPYDGRLVPRDDAAAGLVADIGAQTDVAPKDWPALIAEAVSVTVRVVGGSALDGTPVSDQVRFLAPSGFEMADTAPAGEITNPRKITFSNNPPG